jgi:hypothetical protein
MYNILNPIHYIAANNPNGTIGLLIKYNLPAPDNDAEMATAVDFAASQIGEPFLRDIAHLHPDKNYLISMTGLYQYRPNYQFSNLIDETYKTSVSAYTIDQLKNDIAGIQQLIDNPASGLTAEQKSQASEKLVYLNQLLTAKTNPATSTTVANKSEKDMDIQKKNHYLLLALAAVALMFIGSKVIKN